MPQIITSQATARPAYYDRSPDMEPLQYNFTTGGVFAVTEMFNFTPSTSYAGFLENGLMYVKRVTAAGAVGVAAIELGYYVNGLGLTVTNYNPLVSNVVGTEAYKEINQWGFVKGGDWAMYQAYDTGTGGNVLYWASMKALSFKER
jgi:hypothetical protein